LNTILLVEDNEDDVFAFKYVFRKAGISDSALNVVTDGQQAMNYLAGAERYHDRGEFPFPTVVFLDLKLPFYSGHEILKWIRSESERPSVPVVILTGSDESRDHEQTAANGANGYLVKPASLEDIQWVLKAQGLSIGRSA